jgi:glutamate/tyrosine decarboxylase-like PLP-dependent enzyme
MPCQKDDELAFELTALEERLKAEKDRGRGVILVYGLGEVNTGGFDKDLPKVAQSCRKYGAWLHIDAGELVGIDWADLAFGGFASVVPELRYLVEGMDQADSLTLDGTSQEGT